jgi:[NiFe] hydrogenase small subunit
MFSNEISRRAFLKYCGGIAATLGLSTTMIPKIAEALTSDGRPPVVWLHFAECTGCSEAFSRATGPGVADILFDVLNVTYHETIQVACGEKAEYNRDQTVVNHAGKFICIVEGAIPTADNGVYGMIGGRTMLDIAQTIIPQAGYTIALGTCAAYGGLPAAAPNPTGAIGVNTINITGCPPHPMNLVACITSYWSC